MSRREQIIRAWKDPEYRARLSAEERAELPESPAGQSVAELEESQLHQAVGGRGPLRNTWQEDCPDPPFLTEVISQCRPR